VLPRRRNDTDRRAHGDRDLAMPRLYMITVPGLQVNSDWAAVRDRLLDDFPQVTDVLATTMAATLLIVYEGDADIDAWLDGVSDGILSRRMSAVRGTGRYPTAPRPGARAEVHPRAGKESSVTAS
jgi:hypothetical protein